MTKYWQTYFCQKTKIVTNKKTVKMNTGGSICFFNQWQINKSVSGLGVSTHEFNLMYDMQKKKKKSLGNSMYFRPSNMFNTFFWSLLTNHQLWLKMNDFQFRKGPLHSAIHLSISALRSGLHRIFCHLKWDSTLKV